MRLTMRRRSSPQHAGSGGRIIIIGSVNGDGCSQAGNGQYAASKSVLCWAGAASPVILAPRDYADKCGAQSPIDDINPEDGPMKERQMHSFPRQLGQNDTED